MAITFDPAHKGPNIVLSNGNLSAVGSGSGWNTVLSTATPRSSGKWYYEATATLTSGTSGAMLGVADAAASLTTFIGTTANTCGWQGQRSIYYNGTNNTNAAPGYG